MGPETNSDIPLSLKPPPCRREKSPTPCHGPTSLESSPKTRRLNSPTAPSLHSNPHAPHLLQMTLHISSPPNALTSL